MSGKRIGTVMANWSDMLDAIRTTRMSWERFVTTGSGDSLPVRPEILRSWLRCYQQKTPPDQREAPTVLPGDLLAEERRRQSDLLAAAAPVLRELGGILQGTGHIITLCDANVRVLEVAGDRQARRVASRINLLPGAGWSEAAAGTNAMGTALAEGQPVIVFAAEHYCAGIQDWACAAAPIRSPTTGELLGVIDLSGRHTVLNNHALGMVTAAARSVEGRLYEQYLQRRSALLVAYAEAALASRGCLVLAVDADGEVADATDRSHPLLVATGRGLRLCPPAQAAVQAALGAPGEASRRVDEVETPAGRFTLTYAPVRKGTRACGLLVYVWPHGSGGRGRTAGAVGGQAGDAAALGGRASTPGAVGGRAGTSAAEVGPGGAQSGPFAALVGQDPAFCQAVATAARAAAADAPVLILGETGTGKELFARAIHQASGRAGGPFVAVNCGALPRDLAASELFGYAPGAFTGAAPGGQPGKFEVAHGGTLFLDEIGELPLELQAYLLRVLQEREVVRVGSHRPVRVNVRVIAATHRDLRRLVAEGRFRADLYWRLAVVEIHLPPLRERPGDLPLLIDHFLASLGCPPAQVPADVLAALQRYPWPGNVRELRNVLERAAVLGADVVATLLAHVRGALPVPGAAVPPVVCPTPGGVASPPQAWADPVLQALMAAGGNVARAARELGVARSTIYRRLRAVGLRLDRLVRTEA